MDSNYSLKGDEFMMKGDKALKGILLDYLRFNIWQYFWL